MEPAVFEDFNIEVNHSNKNDTMLNFYLVKNEDFIIETRIFLQNGIKNNVSI